MILFRLIAVGVKIADVNVFPVGGAERRSARDLDVAFKSNRVAVARVHDLIAVEHEKLRRVADIEVIPGSGYAAGVASVFRAVLTFEDDFPASALFVENIKSGASFSLHVAANDGIRVAFKRGAALGDEALRHRRNFRDSCRRIVEIRVEKASRSEAEKRIDRRDGKNHENDRKQDLSAFILFCFLLFHVYILFLAL